MGKRLGRVLAVALGAVVLSTAASANAVDPAIKKAADDFYAVYVKLSPGGVPNAEGMAKLTPLISPALKTLLEDAAKVEDEHTKATNNEEPPYLEGDIFTSTFEGANEFKVGGCKMTPTGGECTVALTYDPKGKPVTWSDTVVLVADKTGVRVDDIVYGGNWDFGNKGKLSDTLKGVIAEGKKTTK